MDYTGVWTSASEEWLAEDGTKELESGPDTLVIEKVQGELFSGTLALSRSESTYATAGLLCAGRLSFEAGESVKAWGSFWTDDVLALSVAYYDDDGRAWGGNLFFVRNGAVVPEKCSGDFRQKEYTCVSETVYNDSDPAEGVPGGIFSVKEQLGGLMWCQYKAADGKTGTGVAVVSYTQRPQEVWHGEIFSGGLSTALTIGPSMLRTADEGLNAEAGGCVERLFNCEDEADLPVLAGTLWRSAAAAALDCEGTPLQVGTTELNITDQSGCIVHGTLRLNDGDAFEVYGALDKNGSWEAVLNIYSDEGWVGDFEMSLRGGKLLFFMPADASGYASVAVLAPAQSSFVGRWFVASAAWISQAGETVEALDRIFTLTVDGTADGAFWGQFGESAVPVAGMLYGRSLYFDAVFDNYGRVTFQGEFATDCALFAQIYVSAPTGEVWCGSAVFTRHMAPVPMTLEYVSEGDFLSVGGAAVQDGQSVAVGPDDSKILNFRLNGRLFSADLEEMGGISPLLGTLPLSRSDDAAASCGWFITASGHPGELYVSVSSDSSAQLSANDLSDGSLKTTVRVYDHPLENLPAMAGRWEAAGSKKVSPEGQTEQCGLVTLDVTGTDGPVLWGEMTDSAGTRKFTGYLSTDYGSTWTVTIDLLGRDGGDDRALLMMDEDELRGFIGSDAGGRVGFFILKKC